MKTLRIINGEPEYIDCSMYGSYYLPCKIIKRNKKSVRIEYENERGEPEQATIPNNEIEEIQRFYNKHCKKQILKFLENVRFYEISFDKATEIILNDGEIKL